MARAIKDWQAPMFEFPDTKKLGWLKEAIEDGDRWVRDQVSTEDIQAGIDLLAGRGGDLVSQKWSEIRTGDLQRSVREVIETLANIRLSFSGYQTNNAALRDHANMMNKVAQTIYLKYFVDRSLRDSLQFGALTGAGFISPYVDRSLYGTGRSRFVFEALSQLDVLPVQLPRDRNYQEAYVVTISRFMPVAKAHALFPAYQMQLVPFAKNKYVKGGSTGRLTRNARSDRWRMHSIDTLCEQYCEIFYTYILDLRLNDTDAPIPMGQPGTSWFYEVPYMGQEIQRWAEGRMQTRAAAEDDCRLYPQRRLQISCDAALMYDGPGFDWHGMVPAIPFYLNDWAWEGTGFSLFSTTAPLQNAIDALERSIFRIAMARANPGKAYNADMTSRDAKLSTRQAEALDPFDPNLTLAVDGDLKEPPLKPPMPEWCYNIPEWVPQEGDRLREAINRQLGLDQIQALQKFRANITDPDKLIDSEGPVVIGTSRSMERGLRELGEMTKFNVLQYMPTGVLIQMVGVDQVPQAVFDYDPDSLIPSHQTGEQTFDAEGQLQPSQFSRSQRARHFAENLEYVVAPHSLHEVAQNKERLNLLALQKQGGVPIDPETMATKFDLSNWGSLDGSTIMEKYLSWAKVQVLAKAQVAKLEAGLGLQPPEPPPGKSTGRPNTNKKPPQAKQKGPSGGGRPVVTTS